MAIGGHLSHENQLENRVPQGSIFQVVSAGFDVLLYADDILLVVRRLKTEGLHRKLQAAVKAVDKWSKSVGSTILLLSECTVGADFHTAGLDAWKHTQKQMTVSIPNAPPRNSDSHGLGELSAGP